MYGIVLQAMRYTQYYCDAFTTNIQSIVLNCTQYIIFTIYEKELLEIPAAYDNSNIVIIGK